MLKKEPLTFREYINRSTNLLTVVGILNAIIIFSNSYETGSSQKIVDILRLFIAPPCFLITFLVVCEIIRFAFESATIEEKYKFIFFVGLMVNFEIGFIFIYLSKYALLSIGLIFSSIFILLFSLFLKISRKIFKKIKYIYAYIICFIVTLILILVILYLFWDIMLVIAHGVQRLFK